MLSFARFWSISPFFDFTFQESYLTLLSDYFSQIFMLFIVFLKLSILFIFLLICTSICFNPFSVFSKVLVFFKFSICLSFACCLADTVHLCLMIRSPGCLFTLNKGAWELTESHHPLMQLTENPQKTVQSFGWQLPHSNLTMLLLWSGSILERHFVPLLEEEGLN